MISLMTGKINVVCKFWNQIGLCGVLKLITLILEKMLTICPKSSRFLPMYTKSK